MDQLDRKIIGGLQRDGRAPNAQIARELGVSEGTVRRRLNRLLREGFIRVQALIDPAQMGYLASAFIGLQVEPPRIEEVADQLADLKETEYVAITTGAYDVFIRVNVASANQLAKFLHTKVGIIPGVRHTETFVTLETKMRLPGPAIQG